MVNVAGQSNSHQAILVVNSHRMFFGPPLVFCVVFSVSRCGGIEISKKVVLDFFFGMKLVEFADLLPLNSNENVSLFPLCFSKSLEWQKLKLRSFRAPTKRQNTYSIYPKKHQMAEFLVLLLKHDHQNWRPPTRITQTLQLVLVDLLKLCFIRFMEEIKIKY